LGQCPVDDPAAKAFFADAVNHSVAGTPVNSSAQSTGVFALVSFTSDLPTDEWEAYKAAT